MINFIKKTLIISELEIRKIIHDPSEIITRSVQPALWLLIFGQVFAKMPFLANRTDYLSFMTPGILAQSVLFVSIFSGIAIIWERDLGLIQKMLSTPTPRTAMVLGKAISAGFRTLPIVIIIYLLALILGVSIHWDVFKILGVLLFVFLGSIFFSTFSLIIACLVKTRERFMGIGQLLTMPLFFASNAIYPIEIMPDWLKMISHVNPLTYVIDALRSLMLDFPSNFGVVFDFGVLFIASFSVVLIGGVLYKRVAV
ncbi:daunorubicin resistance ABC transporter membrane protein [Leptospira fainei serovar Hurstbridge str. BUT 6]|uniref:Transport permease protein n=1 Tax=Leptospira fainei serovar Hurstbridge str. BUT 6 TaxID=1193011 RepID=S3V573_9LEPT|nr:ABC transporter permease [Leptospira fainei]EPG75784.1 daunorubicin resistance ABC transporter membrane protein [Leptospira fainei serovar Hurstbridge str. BUT 6]